MHVVTQIQGRIEEIQVDHLVALRWSAMLLKKSNLLKTTNQYQYKN